MADISFLKLHYDKNKAWDLGDSPQAEIHYLGQIQLLPRNPKPYVQITTSEFSLSVEEDYAVYFVKCSTGEEIDVSDNVTIINFTENGIGQIKITISYLCDDFSSELLYLKIDRGSTLTAPSYYYSNRFLVTNENAELTSRIDYKDKTRDVSTFSTNGLYQSIQLQFYSNNPVNETEIDTYYQVTRSQVINPRISQKEFISWKTQPFNSFTYKRLIRAFYTGTLYIDGVRNYPVEGLKINERVDQTNINEMDFITDPDYQDKINVNPIYVSCPVPDDLRLFLSSSSIPSSSSKLSSDQYENA